MRTQALITTVCVSGAAGPHIAAGRSNRDGVPGDVPPTKNVYVPDRISRAPLSPAKASDAVGMDTVTMRLGEECVVVIIMRMAVVLLLVVLVVLMMIVVVLVAVVVVVMIMVLVVVVLMMIVVVWVVLVVVVLTHTCHLAPHRHAQSA